jgi:hypothetical protein
LTANHEIIDAFREAASQGASVVARRNGDRWEVRAVGSQGNPVAVEWRPLEGQSGETYQLFMDGLRQFFGEPIGREMALQGSGDALDAKAVLSALDMAADSRAAFAGLNFISRQAMSARSMSPQFRVVCMALSMIPEKLPPDILERADAGFARRFADRSDSDRRSVDLIEARLLMAEALTEALQPG